MRDVAGKYLKILLLLCIVSVLVYVKRYQVTPYADRAKNKIVRTIIGWNILSDRYESKLRSWTKPDTSKLTIKIETPAGPAEIDVDDLIKDVKSSDIETRKAAIEHITDSNNPEILPALAECLNNSNPSVRLSAIRAISALAQKKITNAQILPELIYVLRDESADVRTESADAISNMKGADVIPLLIDMLGDENIAVQASVKTIMLKVIDKESMPYLIANLEDEKIGGDIAEIMSKINDPEAIPNICKFGFRNSAWEVRAKIARMMGYLNDTRAVPYLIEQLDDDDPYVRAAAVTSLGKLKDTSALIPLQKMLAREKVYRIQTEIFTVYRKLEKIKKKESESEK